MNKVRQFIEWQVFGVCSALGDKLGIATSRIRTWFIYISFLTMGSPVNCLYDYGVLAQYQKIHSFSSSKPTEIFIRDKEKILQTIPGITKVKLSENLLLSG